MKYFLINAWIIFPPRSSYKLTLSTFKVLNIALCTGLEVIEITFDAFFYTNTFSTGQNEIIYIKNYLYPLSCYELLVSTCKV